MNNFDFDTIYSTNLVSDIPPVESYDSNFISDQEILPSTAFNLGKEIADVSSELAHRRNANFFSETLLIPYEKAYEMEPLLIKQMYSNKELSSENFFKKIKLQYDAATSQNRVGMLRYNQLLGDTSQATEDAILKAKAGMPPTTELDRITNELTTEKNIFKNVLNAVGSIPYVATSQIPMWVDGSKYALAGAVSGAALASWGGVSAGIGFITGATLGSAQYEFMLESGLAQDRMIEKTKEAGLDIDPRVYRGTALVSGAIIAAIDSLGLVGEAKAVLKSGKIIANTMMKDGAKYQAKTATVGMLLKNSTEAAAIETVTEPLQDGLAALNEDLKYRFNEIKELGHIEPAGINEIVSNMSVTMATIAPFAFVSAGLGGSIAAVKYKAQIAIRNKVSDAILKNYLKQVNEETTTSSTEQISIYNYKRDDAAKSNLTTAQKVINRENKAATPLVIAALSGKIVRPSGVYSDFSTIDMMVDDKLETISLEREKDGNISIKNIETNEVLGTVTQGAKEGVDVSIVSEMRDKDRFAERISLIVKEGSKIEPSLNFTSENTNYLVHHIQSFEALLSGESIKDLKDIGLNDIVKELSDEMDVHESTSKEYIALEQSIYNYIQLNERYSNLASELHSIEDRMYAAVNNKDVPVQVRERMLLAMDKVGARFKLTQKEIELLNKIKKNKDGKPKSGDEHKVVEKKKKTPLKDLQPKELSSLYQALLKMEYGSLGFLSQSKKGLKRNLAQLLTEVDKELIAHDKEISGYDSVHKSIRAKGFTKAKSLFVLDQRKFYNMIEFIAGKNSTLYKVLYEQPQRDVANALAAKHRITDNFVDVFAKGATEKERRAFQKKKFESGDQVFTSGQALTIYMNSLRTKNKEMMETYGIRIRDNSKAMTDKEVIRDIIKQVYQDSVAMAAVRAMQVTFAELGVIVKPTFEAMTGREFPYDENYFPIYTDETLRMTDDDATLTADSVGAYITYSKAFTMNVTEAVGGLILVDAFTAMNKSIKDQTLYAFGEKSMWTASKMILDNKVKKAIEASSSPEHYDRILSQLKVFAGQKQKLNTLDSLVLGARNMATKSVVAGNLFIALKAPGSWILGWKYLEPSFMFQALSQMKTPGLADEMISKIPLLAERKRMGAGSAMNDLNDATMEDRLATGRATYDSLGFAAIRGFDMFTSTSVALGGYLQAQEQLSSGKMSKELQEAIDITPAEARELSFDEKEQYSLWFAEYVLNRTQPAVSALDKNSMQVGTPLQKTFSTFGSFTNLMHNLLDEAVHAVAKDGTEAMPLVGKTLALFMLTSMSAAGVDYLKELLLGRDHKKAWGYIGKAIFGDTFYIRDIYGIVESKLTHGAYAGGKDGSLALDRLGMVGVSAAIYMAEGSGLIGGEWDSRKFEKGLEYLLEGVALSTGAPMSMRYILEFAKNMKDGDE